MELISVLRLWHIQLHLLTHIPDFMSWQYLLSSSISHHRFHFIALPNADFISVYQCLLPLKISVSTCTTISFATSAADIASASVLHLWQISFHFPVHITDITSLHFLFLPQISFQCFSWQLLPWSHLSFSGYFHWRLIHTKQIFFQFQLPARISLQLRLLMQIISKVSLLVGTSMSDFIAYGAHITKPFVADFI